MKSNALIPGKHYKLRTRAGQKVFVKLIQERDSSILVEHRGTEKIIEKPLIVEIKSGKLSFWKTSLYAAGFFVVALGITALSLNTGWEWDWNGGN
jgi:hypothetical protein